MRDAASSAAMSDPENNRWFRRRWSDDTVQPASMSVTAVAGATAKSIVAADDRLTLLGHDLLQQWRRERAGEEAVR